MGQVKECRHQRLCITIIGVRKHPTGTGDRLPDVSQRAQVGFLGLMPMLPQQSIGHLVLQVSLQQACLYLMVNNHL